METDTVVRTGRRFRAADRALDIARRVKIQAELATMAKRSLEDSTFTSTALFTIAQASIFAVIAALYVAIRAAA